MITRCVPIRTAHTRRAFSLPEMLLAVFILGIGIISIAALFPVGLTQQRRSTDDLIGPVIASNAYEVIRSKVSAEDFGYRTDYTIAGDFIWSRPQFVFGATPAESAIDLFGTSGGNTTNSELPHNIVKYPSGPPTIVITQGERYFPVATIDPGTGNEFISNDRPQYAWDCAFRRFGGKVQVAIFVYRVEAPGGQAGAYAVAPGANNIPPLPVAIDLTQGNANNAWDVWGADNTRLTADDRIIPGTDRGTQPFNPVEYSSPYQNFFLNRTENQGWQFPGQWLLDQNNNIHRVLAGRRTASDGPVELVERIPEVPLLPVYDLEQPFTPPSITQNVVRRIWYIPPVDSNGWTLTPVYISVREL